MTNSSSDRKHPSPGPLSVLKFGKPQTARLSRQITRYNATYNLPQFMAKAGVG
jgi:hypothetical protein